MKGRILIVEDEASLRNIEKMILEGAGYEVLTAEDPETGLGLLEKGDPKIDLLVLDIMLPKFDGFEALRRLRQMPNARAVPVIVLSAQTEHRERIKGLNLGAVEYLGKPFKGQDLLRAIDECLFSSRGKAAT